MKPELHLKQEQQLLTHELVRQKKREKECLEKPFHAQHETFQFEKNLTAHLNVDALRYKIMPRDQLNDHLMGLDEYGILQYAGEAKAH